MPDASTPALVRAKRAAEPVIAGPSWSLSPPTNADTATGDAVLANRLATAIDDGSTHLLVPENSSLGGIVALYGQLLDRPEVREWLTLKGLAADSLILRKNSIEGFSTVNGLRTAVKFSATDDSGWWQASVRLRAMRDVLDPEDKGMPYLATREQRVPLHVVLHAYGLQADTPGHVATLKVQLGAQAVALTAGLASAVNGIRQTISDLDERDYLASVLEQHVRDLPDNRATDWSTWPTLVSQASAETIGVPAPHTIAQLLESKGLGSPRTVEATRHVIQWLRISLPPAPAMGDYTDLISSEVVDPDYRALATLAAQSPQSLRVDVEAQLDRLRNSTDAAAFSQQLTAALNGPAGTLGGYEPYQAANMGRSLGEVREDLERYLREHKGLAPNVAALVAHIGLARTAPEFLVRDIADEVAIGTPAWMTLRLGCAIAETVAPGLSRVMSGAQIAALTTLAPTSDEQRAIMQVHGMGLLLDWAVLNGVLIAKPQGQHTQEEIKKASQVFNRQRTLATRAFEAACTPLPTRKGLAVEQLLKVFPNTNATQLEAMTVFLADSDERRNLRASEPRTRSLIEAYMTGDLVPGKWVLSSEVTDTGNPTARTPFQFQSTVQIPAQPRQALDAKIRRLPVLNELLEKAVATHHRKQQMGYVTQLKLSFSRLPLADRQRIEWGAVDLFTLRKKTGKQYVWESQEDRAAVTGRQGSLLRVLHEGAVTYYEVFSSGKVIKHDNPHVTQALDGVVRDKRYLGQYKLQGERYIRSGHEVPLDFEAYASGAAPRAGMTSADVIIDRLGRSDPARPLPANMPSATLVPDSYQSDRIEFIACEIAENNFYEPVEEMLTRAKGQLPVERSRDAHARDVNLLTSLVPFVGAYRDFAAGNIGKGLQSLALDLAGLTIGAGGQAHALFRSVKNLGQVGLQTSLRQVTTRVTPIVSKPAWTLTAPKVRFRDAAFDVSKQTAQFFNAAFNPLEGYPRLINAVSRGGSKLPALLTTGGHLGLGKAMPHLKTAEEKMRGYFLIAMGQADPTQSPASPAT